MPKVDIDYSNTIFYKIFCKDPTIKDIYVGMTTNFVQRKHAHKQSCKNGNAPNHNCKLYNYIRSAGGWESWEMEIIAFHNCNDSHEAHKKEQEYFEMLGATLNSIEPLPKPKKTSAKIVKEKTIMFCEACNIHFLHWKAQERHNNTNKHQKMILAHKDSNLTPKVAAETYVCELCDYTCSKQSDFNKHLGTGKHKRITMDNSLDNKIAPREYKCECDRKYTFCSGLSKHKKKCNFLATSEIKQDKNEDSVLDNKDVMIEKLMEELTAERAEKSDMKSMFMMMMEKFQEMQTKTNENTREMLKETVKGNQELVNKVIDVIPKMGNTTNNNNTLKKRVE
jgi:DNA-directed RNA polymerase subunit F